MLDPHDSPSPHLTHIGLVLERVRRQAGLGHEPLAHRTGVDLDYVTGVLRGTRFPSRRFIVRYARTCGADPQVLLKVWDDEHERLSSTAGHPVPGNGRGPAPDCSGTGPRP